MDALVTDTHTRAAVAGLRGLGRAGLAVVSLAPRATAAGGWSRHAAVSASGPDVLSDPVGFRARVAALAAEYGPLHVYPVQEESIDALYRDGVDPDVRLPYPGDAPVRRLRDKRSVPELAADVGLTTPATLAQGTAADLLAAELPVPCVVKPVAKGGAIGTARPATSPSDLAALLGSLPPDEPLVVQQRLTGRLISIGIVVGRDGEVVSRFQHDADRTWPAEAGSTARAVSVAPDPRAVDKAARLLASAGYWGLAELEFLESAAGLALIDINPRFYGCMPLALASGVNLPAAWHAVATGGPVPAPTPYRLGVTYRWLKADVVAAAKGDPRRLLYRSPSPRSGAMWASDDPLPGAVLAAGSRGERMLHRLGARPRGFDDGQPSPARQ